MNNYIPAGTLIAEIERQMNECIGRFGEIHKLPEYRCLKNIHSYITSLQQEQPHFADASKMEQPEVDLRKIIEQTYHDESVADTSNMDHVDYENIALYFYELGLNARREK